MATSSRARRRSGRSRGPLPLRPCGGRSWLCRPATPGRLRQGCDPRRTPSTGAIWPGNSQVPGPFRRTTDVLPPASGFIVPLRAVGDRVQAKGLIARIHSLLGDLAAEIEAPHAGQIWAMRHLRAIQEGEIVTSIAEPAGAEES